MAVVYSNSMRLSRYVDMLISWTQFFISNFTVFYFVYYGLSEIFENLK